MSTVTTLYAVLREPIPTQHRVMIEIADIPDRFIVMSQHPSQFLHEV